MVDYEGMEKAIEAYLNLSEEEKVRRENEVKSETARFSKEIEESQLEGLIRIDGKLIIG